MKASTFISIVLSAAALLFCASAFGLGENTSPEASEEIRLAAAKAKLSSESGTVVLYAKGLCCPSCAIGIRKMVSKLDFVDRRRFNKGVLLDAKTQLVTVAIAEGREADQASLSKAVADAGYDPERVYFLENDSVSSFSIARLADR